ncbi:uncharacterized protein LOC661071 isoform X1 [Tribolium castaneum]|uniref:Uncharacterized protein n=2 Tax=Tribolium castaneum TaxID=7070 RepID=D6X381_TRICA|nr:PREDICTED: uncharacterized protein LOC661071 isoform X1 [Tribolium castaneum]EFA09789.1 hypothetical protein TcasGA2_TC011931 [Tribolium castaneum]|eukprot:XP_976368.1 PREDICTED: uncharacterized protein LOC661071 isoform X1 [Tribolium castaneum]
MACHNGTSLLAELSDLVQQIGDCQPCSCCPPPQCIPCNVPYAQVTMTCPPPILVPTQPQPVKPLQLPCPPAPPSPPILTPEEAERSRYDNFYNNYNIDWHNDSSSCKDHDHDHCCTPEKQRGQTVDGKTPCCEDYTKNKQQDECRPLPGCPTGFKPCTMKLTPPPGCDPCGIWCAQVQPCPPKPKKKSKKYEPGPCTRPCCKHWKPKEGPCLYDDPCKAHCFNHPPGIKPSGRYP